MLTQLPPEILYTIADLLGENDVNSLVQSNSGLFCALNPVLYRKNMLKSDGWALIWAIINRLNQTVAHALGTGATLLGEALALAVEDGQEQVVEQLLNVQSADFSPQYDFYGQFANWTSQRRIACQSTAVSSRCVEQLKARQQWEHHGTFNNKSPLSRACRGGHFRIVNLLIESNGADLDVEDLEGKTPLFYAVEGGFVDIAKALFNTGHCDLSIADVHFKTVLSHAAGHGDSEMVQWLVSCGNAIDLNHQDRCGETPLHYAAALSDASTTKVLIESGRVDPSITNLWDQTPLHLATQRSNTSIMKLLTEHSNAGQVFRRSNDRTPLLCAAKGSGASLDFGSREVDLNPTDLGGNRSCTLLHGSTEGRDTAFLQLCSDFSRLGSHLSEKQCQCVLSHAIYNSDTATVKLLISSGNVDLDWKDGKGRTPLSYAAQYSDISILKLLIDSGRINLDSRDEKGRTPLSYAAEHSDASTVKLLIHSGEVDVDSKDNQGRTPLSYAVEHVDLSNMTTLVTLVGTDVAEPRAHPHPNELLPRRSLAGTSTLKTLIDSGKADLNVRDRYGRTPLAYAAECSDSATVKLLLESSLVQADSKDNGGRTPFFEAIASGNLSTAEILLNSKMVNPNPRDDVGDAPIFELLDLYSSLETIDHDQILHGSIYSTVEAGYNRLLKLLLRSNEVNWDFRNYHGQTPLVYAAEECGYDVVRLLIDSGKVDPGELSGQ